MELSRHNLILLLVNLLVLCSILQSSVKLVEGQTTRDLNGSTCINGPSFHYDGTQNVTRTNLPCVRWDSSPANISTYVPLDGGNHNYCRNPTNDPNGIWCYTSLSFGNITREYCFLPKCTTDARVIWTAYNVVNRTTHLFALHADPELIRQNLSPQRTVSVEHYFNSTGSQSEIWTLTSDYASRRIFFADYRAEYIGVHSFNTSTTEVYHDGMGHGVENLAHDPISKNLYWTDSELKWVMMTDPTFSYYTIIFSTDPDPAYALAIHIPKRRLFFSTYRNQASKIWSTDMAGQNATAIFNYPDVDDVTSITIDYADDRLYWTDFVGTGSRIYSSKLDGTNKTLVYSTRSSIYWALAIHLQYIYVTDVRTRFTSSGRRQYYIFMISKFGTPAGRRVLNYGLSSKPRGITVFEENSNASQPSVYPDGECSASPPCDQLCLPSLTGSRVCACSLGYVTDGDTGCTTRDLADESMILADAGQGKVFHIPLSATNVSEYNVIPLDINTTITTIAVNVAQRLFYWSDSSNSTIYRATFDGGNVTALVREKHAKRMAIDQLSGNVFFVDDDFQNIFVMNSDGLFLKTLYKPEPDRVNSSSVGSIALDTRNKFIFWTDTNRATGRGELRRMRFDGSQSTLVLTNLTRPTAVTVDLEGDKLYLGEGTIPLIYEFPLTNMTEAEMQSVDRNSTTTYDLTASFRGTGSTFLSEIQVLNGRLYFYDGGNRSMEVFDLARGTTSVRPFGPREFFRVRSMTLFSASYYQNFDAAQGNPCPSLPCDQLCLAITGLTRDCDCQDGWSTNSRGICVNRDTAPVDHPPIVSGCEADRNIVIEPCQNQTRVSWLSPLWSDDITASADLVLNTFHNITSPSMLSLGQYRFRYSATDDAGNIGLCAFSITISSITCGTPPFVRDNLNIEQTQPMCNNNAGLFSGASTLSYFLSCSTGQMLNFGNFTNTTLVNDCMPSGRWRYSNFFGIRCGPPTTAAPTTTPLSTTTSSTAVTTSTSTASTTEQTSRSTAAPDTTTTSQRTTTSQQTTPPSTTLPSTTPPTTTTTVPTTTTTPTTTVPTTTTPTSSPTTTARTISVSKSPGPPTTTTTIANNGNIKLPSTKKQAAALSGGAIAGIIILALALFAIIGAVFYVKFKKSGAVGFTFWKKSEDNAQLRENVFDDINHYTVL